MYFLGALVSSYFPGKNIPLPFLCVVGETCCLTSYILLASKELLLVVFFSFGDSLRSLSPNKLVRRAMDFTLNKIGKYVDNHTSVDQRMKDLKRKLEQLNGLKEEAESIMTTELQPRKKLKAEVQIWLKNVEKINGQVQDLDGRIAESYVFTRGLRVEDVSRKIKEVEELINQRRQFHGGLVVDNSKWIGQVLSTTTLSGEAVKACVEEIWQCLMDDEVRKIGVWGMGGVGKTSIMKVVNNQILKETGKFDIVIWITVSKEMNIAKLQRDIASRIGVDFYGDEDETTRAGKLFETLSQKSRFVMILDDLWEKVSLERIGIPEPFVGSKLVLTTRSADVCKQMDCKVIEVKRLTEEEAWKLFSEKVGPDILNNPEVELIARPISKRCREDEEIEEEELIQLWIGEGLVEGVDSIQAEIYRGRAIMNILIRNCLLEGFSEMKNERTVKMHDLLRDMALNIAGSRFLVKSGMMLGKPLDMQDWGKDLEKVSLMQNWRLYIPSEMSPPKCPRLSTLLLCHCRIESIPKGFFKHTDGLRIFDFSGNRIKSLPISLSKCSRLTTLLLTDCKIASIPRGFFKHMDVLRILDLSGNPIKSLPRSLSKCPKLIALFLSGCSIESIPKGFFKRMHALEDLDLSENPIKSLPRFLSKCHKLIALSLSGCEIVSIPEGFFNHMNGLEILNLSENPIKSLSHSLSNLKNLTSLSLAGCEDLENVPSLSNLRVLKKLDLQGTNIKEIPQGMENLVSLEYLNLGYLRNIKEGMLSRLCCLQHLRVGKTVISGKEVGGLKKLEVLEGRFEDWDNLNMYLQGREEPPQYRISVGDVELDDYSWNEDGKIICVSGCKIYTYQMMLPPDIEGLEIHNYHLDCSEQYPLFSRSILASFSSLKYLSIYDCRNMKKLFSPNCVPLNLQKLSVSKCEQLEEIIASEVEQEERGGMGFRLPQLRQLELCDLPELKRICSVHAHLVCDSLVQISIVNCVKLEKMSLNLPPPAPYYVSIRISPKEWWESVEWDAKPRLKPIF
ncbi:hypothetical protein V6N11_030766 [Hibiscus sabdariffa]|uniref:NB-ARC domain-containing protein n=1 Tax=Hibiscus sabdariffa TaxID=183260 RepID=A0ABR2NBS3_9ROSI